MTTADDTVLVKTRKCGN